MLLPLPQSMNETHFSLSGDVSIHPSAAIASGVVLQADPHACLIIGAGVSIGAGSILRARQGAVTIETGACLGSGVLIVGSVTIGANACIGSMTTIFNGCVEAEQVIPPKSLIGNCGRQILPELISQSDPANLNGSEANDFNGQEAIAPVDNTSLDNTTVNDTTGHGTTVNGTVDSSKPEPSDSSHSESSSSEPSNIVQAHQVYGLAAFNELMVSLFPHRQSLDQPLSPTTSDRSQTPE